MVSFGKAVDPNKPYASPTSMTGEQLAQSHCINLKFLSFLSI
jgi:hypothetical protein